MSAFGIFIYWILGEVEPRTLDETDFSFNKGADEIVLVLETHENPENLKMQGIFLSNNSLLDFKNVRIIELSCCTHFSPLFKRALSVLTSVTADLCQDIKEDFSLNGALDGNLPQMKLKNWVRPSTIFSILSSTNNIH